MKLMIASDIHGSKYFCQKMIEAYKNEKADKILLLGDILYHGPRNDLPKEYAPKEVISMLNNMKEEIMCVRGNCEAEVDQMVLDFPVMAEYIMLNIDGHNIYATHGHKINADNPLPFKKGDILLHGHTHVQAVEEYENFTYINPGSVSIPKNGNENSYMIYEDSVFYIKNFAGEIIKKYEIKNA